MTPHGASFQVASSTTIVKIEGTEHRRTRRCAARSWVQGRTPQPLMLSHTADDPRQLPHLVTDRRADRPAVTQPAAAAITARRRMHQRLIGVGDHLTMTALMTRLSTRLAPRTLARRALGRLGRIAGGRPRTVRRVLHQAPLEILHLAHQRQQQINHHLRITVNRRTNLLTPHTRRIPYKPPISCRSRPAPLNAYTDVEVKLGPSRDLVNGEIGNPGHYRAVVHAHK